jgi:hypothetical protein
VTQRVQASSTSRSASNHSANNHASNGSGYSPRPKSACPLCQSIDRVDKVSNIVRSGRGRLVWQDGEVSHYETELSELLDVPPKPKRASIFRTVLGFVPPLLMLGTVFLGTALLKAQDYVDVSDDAIRVARNIGIAWFGVLIPCILIWRYVQSRHELHHKELPLWALARRRWTSLYYCSRDDIIFAPNTTLLASPHEIRSLLYEPPGPSWPHGQPRQLHDVTLRGAK